MLLAVDLSVPSYTQIYRRAKLLGQELEKLSRKRVTDVVIDSTGLKVYGEEEWKVRQHGGCECDILLSLPILRFGATKN